MRKNKPYINLENLAADELDNIKVQVRDKVHYYVEIVWTDEMYNHYIKTLYKNQRTFLKALLRYIKDTKDDYFFSQFESEIYKQWKYDFKRNYKNSL